MSPGLVPLKKMLRLLVCSIIILLYLHTSWHSHIVSNSRAQGDQGERVKSVYFSAVVYICNSSKLTVSCLMLINFIAHFYDASLQPLTHYYNHTPFTRHCCPSFLDRDLFSKAECDQPTSDLACQHGWTMCVIILKWVTNFLDSASLFCLERINMKRCLAHNNTLL